MRPRSLPRCPTCGRGKHSNGLCLIPAQTRPILLRTGAERGGLLTPDVEHLREPKDWRAKLAKQGRGHSWRM